MLIEFRVENHRSLRDAQQLSLVASRTDCPGDTRPRTVAGFSDALLTVAVLYGANASGKSNVLAALSFMREATILSHRTWSPDDGIPRDPFAWGPKKLEPSSFEVTILLDGVRYEYGFTASDSEFLEEWIYAWPHGKKQMWLEREGSSFKFGDNLKGENRLIEEVTRPNALFLSVAVQHKHTQLQPLFGWFKNLTLLNLGRPSHPQAPGEFAVARMLDHAIAESQSLSPSESGDESILERFRQLLRNADIGIVDFRLDRNQGEEGPYWKGSPRFHLKHQSEHEEAWLPLEEESKGTRTLFQVLLPILRAMEQGATLVIDELEASLHPSLAQQIVQQFNNPETNPNNAQLIFTTHDTNLLGTTLGEPVLRRDQVWLTEKDTAGASVLYPLTDYKPRKAENLERGYLQGRYGAIPFLANFSVRGE